MILGVSYPFRKGARGFPEPAYDDEAVRCSLEQILLTALGERVMRPTFGSLAVSRVFDNPTPGTLAAVKHDVQSRISIWEPRVRILRINVKKEQDAKRRVSTVAKIEYIRIGAPAGAPPSRLDVPVGK